MYIGLDIFDLEVFLSGVEILLNIVKEFFDFDYIDFGSGFKVVYKLGDVEIDIEELGSCILECFNKFCEEYGKDFKLMFEFGKFMVSEAGYFFVQVNVIK